MIATYEAPTLTAYGSVGTLTSSAKCSPGEDMGLRDAFELGQGSGTSWYGDDTLMGYESGGIVPNGTFCQNLGPDAPSFTAG